MMQLLWVSEMKRNNTKDTKELHYRHEHSKSSYYKYDDRFIYIYDKRVSE